MAKAQKSRASKLRYISTDQLLLEGFSTPFDQTLDPENRWVKMSRIIPWDKLVRVYSHEMYNRQYGADGINARVAIGSIIIKHLGDLSDRETVLQIQENIYMQYFLGYSSFSKEAPFDPSLMVDFRDRLGKDQINSINEIIIKQTQGGNEAKPTQDASNANHEDNNKVTSTNTDEVTHKGKVILDATACPQDISYPTDLNLLNDAREQSERIIDLLYEQGKEEMKKPRTYRKKARRVYLKTAQKKTKTINEIRKAIGKQLGFINRNISNIHKLLDQYEKTPLNQHDRKMLMVMQTLYDQQREMHTNKTHSVEHRIVSIHQPHVRPIVRGKTNARVEFGAKINVSMMAGFAFLDDLEWEAYNEGTRLQSSVEKYKKRFGYYPQEVLADKIYCNRENRAWLKTLGIKLSAKPLGRPSAVEIHIRPGERNPIEGKFGQAKVAYGMNRIKARLQKTSESWIASIIMVLNLVKLTGMVPYCLFRKITTFSLYLLQSTMSWTINLWRLLKFSYSLT